MYRFFYGLDEQLLAVAQRNPCQIIAARKVHYIPLNLLIIMRIIMFIHGLCRAW